MSVEGGGAEEKKGGWVIKEKHWKDKKKGERRNLPIKEQTVQKYQFQTFLAHRDLTHSFDK